MCISTIPVKLPKQNLVGWNSILQLFLEDVQNLFMQLTLHGMYASNATCVDIMMFGLLNQLTMNTQKVVTLNHQVILYFASGWSLLGKLYLLKLFRNHSYRALTITRYNVSSPIHHAKRKDCTTARGGLLFRFWWWCHQWSICFRGGWGGDRNNKLLIGNDLRDTSGKESDHEASADSDWVILWLTQCCIKLPIIIFIFH